MKLRKIPTAFHSILCITVMTSYASAFSEDYYTAAVFEYARLGDEIRDNAEVVIKANLENYERAARAAAQQEADIILFPEYGLFHPRNRTQVKSFLEIIPNPKEVRVIPCNEPEMFADRPILLALSCMAKANEIVIVANMGGMELCANKRECPEDDSFHYNANVAFDQSGKLIGRYYKEHLFYEMYMDLPREKQDPIFRTSFGKFAMFISFDAIFRKMSQVSQFKDIDAILLSALWLAVPPFYISTQYFQGWAMGNNATLVVANFHYPHHFVTGSGIFMGKTGSIGHTFNPDGISKLIVAPIPRNNRGLLMPYNTVAVFKNGTQTWDDDSKNIPRLCVSMPIGTEHTHSQHDFVCLNENTANYTVVKLTKTADHLEVCNNNMCCQLDYVAKSMNESFYLGVFNGTVNPFTKYFWWEENCFLARCDDVDETKCAVFPNLAKTRFYKVELSANFSSKRIYPSFLADNLKLVPAKDWLFIRRLEKSSIIMENHAGIPLLSATLKGRAYEKDPPYIR